MSEVGTVDAVRVEVLGSFLVAGAAVGATSLTVDDLADFSEDGGWLIVADQAVQYTSGVDETGVLTLATPLTVAAAEGDRVDVYVNGGRASVLYADVYLGDSDDTVECVVPLALRDRIPEGMESGLVVDVDISGDEFYLVDARGSDPVIDASFLDPESTAPREALLDGIPPAASPTPTVTGVPRLLLLKIDPISNHDPVTYEWHIATSNAGAPSATTLHHEDGSSLTSIETLADGTPLDYYNTPGDPESGPKVYYVAVVAKDDDGSAPPSPWVPAQLDPAGTADLAVGAVTAANIEAVLLLASTIKTATAGRRIEFSSDEGFLVFDQADNVIVQFPTTGTDLKINGDLIAQSLTVVDNLNLAGVNNTVRKGAAVTLESQVKKPSAGPTVSLGWPKVDYSTAITPPSYRFGFHLFSGQHWVTHLAYAGNLPRLANYDASTGASLGGGFNLPATGFNGILLQPDGAVNIGGNWFVLEHDLTTGQNFVLKYNSSGVLQSTTPLTTLDDSTSRHGVIGTDGTSVYVVQRVSGSASFHYEARSASTLLVTSSGTLAASGLSTEEPTGLYVGNGDYGSLRFIVTTRGSGVDGARVYTGAGALSETFKQADGEWPAGIIYDGTNFYTLSHESAARAQYTNIADGVTYQFTTTLYDGNATGGTHETDMSPATAKVSARRRAFLVTGPEIPSGGTDDPDRIRVYAGTSAVRTSQWLQATTAVGVRNTTLTALATSGTNPPAANTFGAGAAATFLDSNGTPLLAGDDVGDTAWTPVLTGGTTNPTGYTAVGRYRKTAKYAFISFEITMPANASAGTGQYILSLPPGITLKNVFSLFTIGLRDVSANDSYTILALVDTGGTQLRLQALPDTALATGINRVCNSSVPVTIGVGDKFVGTIVAEIA